MKIAIGLYGHLDHVFKCDRRTQFVDIGVVMILPEGGQLLCLPNTLHTCGDRDQEGVNPPVLVKTEDSYKGYR